MKLNLGCGSKSIDGFVNVDKYPTITTDMIFDFEKTLLPWKSSTIEEVHFIHSLEHMGQTTECYLSIIKELYRICARTRVEHQHGSTKGWALCRQRASSRGNDGNDQLGMDSILVTHWRQT